MTTSDLFSFGPDAGRAAALDARVRGELARSLGEIVAAIGGEIGFGPDQAAPIIRALGGGPVAPALFGLYTDLVVAASQEDAAEAARLARQLISHIGPRRGIAVANLTDADLGAGQAARYRRFLAAGDAPVARIDPVDQAGHDRSAALIAEALALLDEAAPEIGRELHNLLREVVLVRCIAPPDDKEALVLDGACTFYLWGAVFLNADRQGDRVAMAVALVHEATHALLFGMTLGAPLVENDPDQLFPSPLRYDPRPMDGLAHATYVLARMVDCLERLLASGVLHPPEAAAAAAALAARRADFRAGLAVVDAAAHFTPDGAAAFGAMRTALARATVAA